MKRFNFGFSGAIFFTLIILLILQFFMSIDEKSAIIGVVASYIGFVIAAYLDFK